MESGDSPNKKDAGLLQTHAGVDHSVKKIRDQIPKQHEGCHDKVERHQCGVIALQDGFVSQTPHTGVGENGFNDHRASDESREEASDADYKWTDRIPQGVLVKNGILVEALGAGCADITSDILTSFHRLAHRRETGCPPILPTKPRPFEDQLRTVSEERKTR